MTDGMQSLEGTVPWRHLVGLEHRLKDEDCVKERIAEDIRVKGRTVGEAFQTLGNAVRFTFQYPEDRYTEGVLGDLGQLTAQGFTEVQRLNFWTRPGEHKGIVSCWRQPQSGTLLEVQFHTRPSYEAWQLTHPAYERLRHPDASDAERADLKAFIRQVYGFLVRRRPPGPAGKPTAYRRRSPSMRSSTPSAAGSIRQACCGESSTTGAARRGVRLRPGLAAHLPALLRRTRQPRQPDARNRRERGRPNRSADPGIKRYAADVTPPQSQSRRRATA